MIDSPVVIERVLNSPIENVWKAITDKEAMKQWYFFDLADFRPEVGFEFSFRGQGQKGVQYLHHCKITEVIVGKKLTYSWRYEGYEGMSYVHFELFTEGGKTRIKLTHEGLETFPQHNTDFAPENFIGGWTEFIGSHLKKFVEGTLKGR